MGVDIVHILRLGAAVCKGHLHGLGGTAAVGPGSGHVIGVAGGAVAHDLRKDSGAPGLGVLQLLQQEDGRTLAQHEAAALRVKGDGSPLGIGILGQGLHGGEGADGQRRHSGLRAAAEHHISITVPDIVEGIAYGIGAAGTGGHRTGAHAPEAGVDGDLAGGHVADAGGDIEGRDPVPALLLALVVLCLRDGEAADAAGDNDAAAIRLRFIQREASTVQCLLGGDDGHLGEAAHPLGLWLAHVVLRHEALDLRGQMDLQIGGIELGDGSDAAHTVLHSLPALCRGKANGGHGPQAGDHDSPSFHSIPPVDRVGSTRKRCSKRPRKRKGAGEIHSGFPG